MTLELIRETVTELYCKIKRKLGIEHKDWWKREQHKPKDYWLKRYLDQKDNWLKRYLDQKDNSKIYVKEKASEINTTSETNTTSDINTIYIETINKRNEINSDISLIIDKIEENNNILVKLNKDLECAKDILNRYSEYLKVKIDEDIEDSELKCVITETRKTESIKCYRRLNNDIFKIQNQIRDANNDKIVLMTRYEKMKDILTLYEKILIERTSDERIQFNIMYTICDIDKRYELNI